MPTRNLLRALALAGLAFAGAAWMPGARAAGPAAYRLAQVDEGDEPAGGGGGDASAMVLRLSRLEDQVRSLTGQVEQLQFQNRRLEENLRKMQADVDFRFQDLQGAAAAPARASAPRPADATASASEAPAAPAAASRPATRRTGDAFDPSADPSAPGAPRPLGTTTPSQPLAGARTASRSATPDGGPLDLMQRPAAPTVIPAPAAAARDPGAVASLAPGGTRDEFEADMGLYRQGQFDGAATGFQAFVDKYPRDKMVPEAVYLAGDSYAKLGRHREAAEQFLKLSTDYGKSPRAPDALLRLGVSLNALGAKDQACATYGEVTRRYPAASAEVRAAVDRELKRARCAGNG